MQREASPHRVSNGIVAAALLSLAFPLVISAMYPESTQASLPAARLQTTMLERTALRLQERVKKQFGKAYSQSSLEEAITERRALLRSSTVVHYEATTSSPEAAATNDWTMRLADKPHWIVFTAGARPIFSLDSGAIRKHLLTDSSDRPLSPKHARLIDVGEKWGHAHATLTGSLRSGYSFAENKAALKIADALENGEQAVAISVAFEAARIYRDDVRYWTELSTGRSTFATSPYGRKTNIRKALNEHLDGMIVAPGEKFSFNGILGGPINGQNGWLDSLIIVNGRDLEPAPGGGICQAATTLYRAMLLAGLPIPVRRNHSLYVHYYEQYGVGLDATVFPGQQDLAFVNDYGEEVFIRSYTAGDEAVVQIFGTPDGREVTMEGPYFGGKTVEGRKLRANEIAWVRTIKRLGATERQGVFSRYLEVPYNLAGKYAGSRGLTELLAAL